MVCQMNFIFVCNIVLISNALWKKYINQSKIIVSMPLNRGNGYDYPAFKEIVNSYYSKT